MYRPESPCVHLCPDSLIVVDSVKMKNAPLDFLVQINLRASAFGLTANKAMFDPVGLPMPFSRVVVLPLKSFPNCYWNVKTLKNNFGPLF